MLLNGLLSKQNLMLGEDLILSACFITIGSPDQHCAGMPRSGKKFWKTKNFPGQGKVRELHFQSGKFKKRVKSHGKVREFRNFPKKMLNSSW